MKPHYRLLLLSSLLLATNPLFASERLKFARINYSPIQNVGEKVIREVYHRAGVGIVVTEAPAKRAAYQANKGERDGEIMRIEAYHQAESPLYRLPYSVGDVKTQVYKRASDEHVQIDNLERHMVAVVRGIRHTNSYVKDFPHVLKTDDVAKAMKLLARGRVDAVVVSQLNGEYEIQAQKLTGIVKLSEPVAVQGIYHYINNKHEHVIDKIESTLKALHESGELVTLWQQYVAEEFRKTATR